MHDLKTTMQNTEQWQYDCRGNEGIIVDSEGDTVALVSILLNSSDPADFEAVMRMMSAVPTLLEALQLIIEDAPKHKHASIARRAIQRAII